MGANRLLIVDDEASVVIQLEEYLNSAGYQIAGVAESGEGAIEQARKAQPDLVLMDIVLSGEMDGIEAAKQIKETLDIPVIFLTAYAEKERVDRAKAVGPLGYIVKPFHQDQVTTAVEMALSKKEMEKALHKANEDLEGRVQERTQELFEVNARLGEEIEERKRLEEELRTKGQILDEVNAALKLLVKKGDEDKRYLEERIIYNMGEMVEPYLEKLKRTEMQPTQKVFLDIVETNIKSITSPFSRRLAVKYKNLTPTEMKVAQLIAQGKDNKTIALVLDSSKRTVEAHRNKIRKKLKLKDRKANLRTHLANI